MKIYYISSIAGSGKTRSAIQYIESRLDDDRCFILFQPTVHLNQSTLKRFSDSLTKTGVVRVINSDTVLAGETVTKTLHDLLTHPGDCKVIITTFAAATLLNGRTAKVWDAIVDEVPDVFTVTSLHSRKLAPYLLDLLEFIPSESDGYLKVEIGAGEGERLKEMVGETRTDAGLNSLRPTAESVRNGLTTYVSQQVHDKFMKGKGRSLTFYHLLKPGTFTGFKSVTMMAANFEESLLYLVWKHKFGVRFTRNSGLAEQGALATCHDERHGQSLSIHYLLDEWSFARKTNPALLTTARREFRRAVEEIFAGDRFIYNLNTSDDQHLLDGVQGSQFVPAKAHGSNDYRDLHCAAIFSIFNQSADRVGFLKRVCGLKEETTWNVLNHEYSYQFCCRTSLRDQPSAEDCF